MDKPDDTATESTGTTAAARKAPMPRLEKWLFVLVVVLIAGFAWRGIRAGAQQSVALPAPAFEAPAGNAERETVVLAGGCFWGVQAVFQHTRGVLNAVSGYAGGSAATADYQSVSSGRSGHAEAVQITYDPRQISYGRLLQIYFSVVHDPTQLDRQGPDFGTQYRSAVFYSSAQQQDTTQRYIAQLDAAKVFDGRIVTQLAPLAAFYPAEAYHQDYATNHPESPYIAAYDRPKIVNLRKALPALYRDSPVLVASQAAAH